MSKEIRYTGLFLACFITSATATKTASLGRLGPPPKPHAVLCLNLIITALCAVLLSWLHSLPMTAPRLSSLFTLYFWRRKGPELYNSKMGPELTSLVSELVFLRQDSGLERRTGARVAPGLTAVTIQILSLIAGWFSINQNYLLGIPWILDINREKV